MFINSLGSLGTQSSSGLFAQFQQIFQQNLQQLEQYAASNPQAAIQMLQSLPPGEQQALMQALEQQDPQGAANVNAAYQQEQQQALDIGTQQSTANNISGIIRLAQNLGKMIGGTNNQTQQSQPQTQTLAQTGPSDGYSSLADMTA